jgi:hypothetical protein
MLIGFLLVSTLIYIFSLKSITGIVLYSLIFGILVFRHPSYLKQLFYFVLINAITEDVIWYFAEVYKSWTTISLLPRVLGQLTVQEMLFSFFWPLSILYVYKIFLKRDQEKIKFPNRSFLIANFLVIFVLVISHFSGIISYLKYSYLYLLGVYCVVIVGLAFWRKIFDKKFAYRNLLWIGILFFVFSVIWEFIALNTNWWVFNGDYVGFVKLLNVYVPYEELIIWIILGAPLMIIFYEASKS